VQTRKCLSSIFFASLFSLSEALFLLTMVTNNSAHAYSVSVIPKQKALADFEQGDNPSIIRALIVLDPAYYFIDKGKQYGISFELLKEFGSFEK